MECNKDEALRAKEIAEKKFDSKDLQGAKKFALKAQALFPGLDGVAQLITTLDIYLTADVQIAGEKDWYSILSVHMSADDETLRKQYRKLVLQLHPDKNKSVGAVGAFQIVKEAWNVLSDKTKRALYDQKRKLPNTSQSTTPGAANGFNNFPPKASSTACAAKGFNNFPPKASSAAGAAKGFNNFPAKAAASKARAKKPKAGPAASAVPKRPNPPHQAPSAPPPAATFWTSCNKCKMNFEYLKVYLNHNLLCPSCREPFIAKEIARPPTENVQTVRGSDINGSNQDTSAGRNFQWGAFSRTAGVASATASSVAAAQVANMVHQTYEKVKREREEAQAAARKEDVSQRKYNPLKRQAGDLNLGTADVASGKKMKILGKDAGVSSSSIPSGPWSGPWANYLRMPGGTIPFSTNSGAYEFQGVNVAPSWKPRPSTRISLTKTFSSSDVRGILIDKMKSDIREKLKEIRSRPSQVAANGNASMKHAVKEHVDSDDSTTNKDVRVDPKENGSSNRTDAENEDDKPFSYTVPDPDFHDFDKDRTEKAFQSDQVWASYDDEDGMPRYYAFVQKPLSLDPFKLKISYLLSRTTSEFGSMNWVSSGFTKTCGDFRIGKYETCDVLNMFSHQIKWEKGPRGVIKIYPQKGDIWAVYRNWSSDWDEDTPDDVLHVYDLVEVLENYDEDRGTSVIPLVKVAGFRTVFQRNQDLNVIKRIPKEEMFRFSHQVPFYRMSGEEAPHVPKDGYDVDPAAISKELLEAITETVEEAKETSEC